MNTLEAIKARRAVKHYDSEFKIPQHDFECLIEHMLQAPSSFNIQHWRVVNIEDRELREQLKEAAWGQQQVVDASLLFILCADIKAWQKTPEQCWQNAPSDVREMMLPMMQDFYNEKEQLQRDEALRSVGIVAQTAMLTAKAMGYDSCPMIGFDQQKVAELINLPDDHLIGMMLAIGRATKPAWSKPGQLSSNDVLIQNRFR